MSNGLACNRLLASDPVTAFDENDEGAEKKAKERSI